MTVKTALTPDPPDFDPPKLNGTQTKPTVTDMQPGETQMQPYETDWEPNETGWEPAVKPDETELTFAQVAERLTAEGLVCNASTLKGRWMSKYVKPAFEGIDCPPIQSPSGKITNFGFTAIGEVVARCINGERGMKISVEALRDEMITRYGLKPVKDKLQDAADLLERAKQRKQESDDQKATSALVKAESKSELDILMQAVNTLSEAEDEGEINYELSEVEKARIAKEVLAQHMAEEEFRKELKQQIKRKKGS